MQDKESHFVIWLLAHDLDLFLGHKVKPLVLLSVHANPEHIPLYLEISPVRFDVHDGLYNADGLRNCLLVSFLLLVCEEEALNVVVDAAVFKHNGYLVLELAFIVRPSGHFLHKPDNFSLRELGVLDPLAFLDVVKRNKRPVYYVESGANKCEAVVKVNLNKLRKDQLPWFLMVW